MILDRSSTNAVGWPQGSYALPGGSEVRFKVGDLVVYPAQGVTEITAIETRDIDGIQHVFYVLKVLDSQKKILVPIGKEESVGLRHVVTSPRIEEVLGVLRQRDLVFENETWNRRSRRYMDKIGSGSPIQLAEVMRDFSVLKGRKILSFGERKMLELARNLLAQELAVALKKTGPDVEGLLDELFHDIVPFTNE
ncbi:MAG: CarD family transcriptional regulator [Deltaproteobacteria bacterium]|nr:CarD family transcriptional regulator [Deltaproteobacteria bacterium]